MDCYDCFAFVLNFDGKGNSTEIFKRKRFYLFIYLLGF